MAKKVSLINMKGGVGKSTLAVNLAWQFAGINTWRNKKILLVDLDPQFNASQYLLGVRRYEELVDSKVKTIWDVFEQLTHVPGTPKPKPLVPDDVIYNVIQYRDGSKIDLIPSRLELAFSLRNPGQKEDLLRKLIAKIDDEYDLIIYDCPPTESLLTTAAYLASDYVLVPVKPEYLSSIGLPLLARSLEEFRTHYDDHDIEVVGIVYNNTSDYAPEEMKSKTDVGKIAKQFGWYIFEGEVSFSRSYPKGAREGKPIFSTSYARSKQAGRFHQFAKEFAQRIGL